MTEEFTKDGERVGYIDLFDPDRGESVGAPDFDDTKFTTESEARRLAEERGWRFRVQKLGGTFPDSMSFSVGGCVRWVAQTRSAAADSIPNVVP